MSDKTFVDTNVLIYAHDVDAKAKRERAKNVLLELWTHRTGALSTQVLQEFYVNVTRKIAKPLSKAEARLIVNSYSLVQ
jgi:predicted nucleic acid-binding protein